MVTPSGTASIPITRAITIGGLSSSATATIEILWDDNSVISSTPILSGSDASRIILVKASSYQGNAVIALKDTDGTIRWSWHIWVTGYTGSETWTNNGYTFMDRNLGATQRTTNSSNYMYNSYGLFYQWGRKDPFPSNGAGYAALNKFKGINQTGAGSTTAVKVSNTSTNTDGIAAGILESIQHPTTFYSAVIDGNWLPTLETTLWNTSTGKKSVYDPCPRGWRVPKGGSNESSSPWYKSSIWSWDSFYYYYSYCYLYYSSKTNYSSFPVAGSREYDGGKLDGVNSLCAYYIGTTDTKMVYKMSALYEYQPSISLDFAASGLSVRCVKE
jgi:hypothetical protein